MQVAFPVKIREAGGGPRQGSGELFEKSGARVHILVTAIGSYGDVHPMIGLARQLQRRGHRVTFVVNPHFADLVRRAGLDMVPLGAAHEYEQVLQSPDLWHPTRGLRTIARSLVTMCIRQTYEIIAERYVPGETAVVAGALDFGARTAQDKLGVPTVTVPLAPVVFRSLHVSPHIPPAQFGSWVPKSLKRLQYWLADRLIADPLVLPTYNAFRAELGLPPVERVFADWWHSPTRVVALFPEWYAPPQPDWPEQVVLTDFPRWDESELGGVSSDVAEFITLGPPPLVFTPGSAMIHGQQFFRAAVAACERLQMRGILLTRYAEQLPRDLPDSIRHFSFVPLSYVLPRAAAVVHHGGIGTLAQGLAAGVPHLIMPMSHDQPDNALRLKRLGVGESISPKHFTPRRVARALDRLITSPRVARNCRTLASRLESSRGVTLACDAIEEAFSIPLAGHVARPNA